MSLAYYQGIPFDQPFIRFYALIIIFAGFVALYLSNVRAHKAGHGMDFFWAVFWVAFPLGIVGARIWYVIANFGNSFLPVFQNSGFWAGLGHCLAFWEGGLAIQGGALLGIIAGVTYVAFRRRGTSVFQIMDFAVPTILVAQAIGRWGNFFNQEVFGHAVSPEAWNFLPSFIMNNMQNGSSPMLSNVTLPSGSVAAPLFLIEGVVNLIFYFLITQGIPAVERKHYVYGDQGFAYFLAYGVVRLILEPLRNPAFIMGSGSVSGNFSDYQSFLMAIAFIVIGLVLIVANHVLAHLTKNGKLNSVPLFRSLYLPEDGLMTISVHSDKKAEEHFFPPVEEKPQQETKQEQADELSKLKALEAALKDKE